MIQMFFLAVNIQIQHAYNQQAQRQHVSSFI